MDHGSTAHPQDLDSPTKKHPPKLGEKRDSLDREARSDSPWKNYKGLCWPLSGVKKAVSSIKISRFKLQRFGAENVSHGGLRSCFWTVAMGAGGVAVRGRQSQTLEGQYERVRLGNLTVCGSHICPVCAPRVAQRRKLEVEQAVKWGQSQGLVPVMLTLTASHSKSDRLDSLIGKQRNALRRWKWHRNYKKAKKQIPHIISAFEETYGSKGWHPHIHLLLFIRADSLAKALRLVASLRAAWVAAGLSEGLTIGRAGFKATTAKTPEAAAKTAGQYLTKSAGQSPAKTWGVAEEMTLTIHKKANGDSRTPADLLADAFGGDSQALGLWQVWVKAVKGRSVLRFSQGLKAAAGIGEVSDEDAATVPDEETEVLIDLIEADLWEHAKAVSLDRDRLIRAATFGRDSLRNYLSALGCHRRTVSTRSDRQESAQGRDCLGP